MLDKETATTIVSMDDFASALTHDLLILHLDVDWAMQAIQSRAVIVRFRESLNSDSRFANITFRRVDCTDQEGAVWDALEELIKPYDRSGTLMVGGNGAVVWVRSGKVVDAVRCAAAEGVDKMTAVTRKAMSAQSTEESGAK